MKYWESDTPHPRRKASLWALRFYWSSGSSAWNGRRLKVMCKLLERSENPHSSALKVSASRKSTSSSSAGTVKVVGTTGAQSKSAALPATKIDPSERTTTSLKIVSESAPPAYVRLYCLAQHLITVTSEGQSQ